MDQIFNELANIFNSNGFRLYLIGSASRDYILGNEIKDYDMVSDALPSDVKKFLNVNSSFEKYGVLTLKYKGIHIDIATLREEKNYIDHRHPNEINFVKDIYIDYKRRDLTINAIYIDEKYNIIDPSNNGVNDLKNQILRFIGDAETRIKEDPLRILRAFRFKEEYNLRFFKGVKKAIFNNLDLLKTQNKSKIEEEYKKYIKIGGKKYGKYYKQCA